MNLLVYDEDIKIIADIVLPNQEAEDAASRIILKDFSNGILEKVNLKSGRVAFRNCTDSTRLIRLGQVEVYFYPKYYLILLG